MRSRSLGTLESGPREVAREGRSAAVVRVGMVTLPHAACNNNDMHE